MSQPTSKDVVALRKKTGLGMMDCKRALEASEGDLDKAIVQYERAVSLFKDAKQRARARQKLAELKGEDE